MAINPHRGEVPVRLVKANSEGEPDELVLRPSFAAISEVEQELGTGLAEICNRFAEVRHGLRDITAIVCAGLKAGGHRERRDIVEERIMATGPIRLGGPCAEWLRNAWFGGVDPTTPSMSPIQEQDQATAATGSTNSSASH